MTTPTAPRSGAPMPPPICHGPFNGAEVLVGQGVTLSICAPNAHHYALLGFEDLTRLRRILAADPWASLSVEVERDPTMPGDTYDEWAARLRQGASDYANEHLELPGFYKVLFEALQGRPGKIAGSEWIQAASWIRETAEGPPPFRLQPPLGLRGWIACPGVVPDPPAKIRAATIHPGPGFSPVHPDGLDL